MKKTLINVFIAIIGCLPLLANAAPNIIPSPPQVAAKAYLLIDAESGKELVSYNADERMPPASLTKLMTSYVLAYELAQGNVSNEDLVTISKNAWAQNPKFAGSSLMWVEVNKQVPLEELHKGVVISSGNDASVAIAEHLAGSESAFADVMNQHAQLLGMQNTHFVNAHGLPHEAHYTSARDLALLAKALMAYPEDYSLYSEREYEYNGITQSNRNRLLWRDSSVDGLKTGHTEEAGYCLVASAQRDGMRLISVVMGTRSQDAREQETQKLLAYGFRYFETHKLYSAGQSVTESKVWAGQQQQVSLGLQQDLFLTIPRGSREQLEAVSNIDDVIKAPVEKDSELGDLVVKLDEQVLATAPLVALEPVEQAGFFKRIWAAIVLFITQLISG